MLPPLFSLSIDLDPLELYLGLHGRTEPLSRQAIDAIPATAAVRFGELCATLGVSGTAFVIARDVERGNGIDQLRALHRDGHEIASHSYAHDYAMSRWTEGMIDADLSRAESVLESAIGVRPKGFRAPGYTLSPTLLRVLARRGYTYDSSLLPSPPYYAAKAAVMAGLAMRGRRSTSILGNPLQLFRSRGPHVVDGRLVELPVSVLPALRVPWIGTLVTALPERINALATLPLRRDPLVVLELHGVDLVDGSDGIPKALLERRADMRLPASTRIARIVAAVRSLGSARRGVSLLEAAGLVRAAVTE